METMGSFGHSPSAAVCIAVHGLMPGLVYFVERHVVESPGTEVDTILPYVGVVPTAEVMVSSSTRSDVDAAFARSVHRSRRNPPEKNPRHYSRGSFVVTAAPDGRKNATA